MTAEELDAAEPVIVPKVRALEPVLAGTLQSVREELELPVSFSREVERAAAEAARRVRPTGEDLTGIPFVTIDPVGATDLDQAMHIEAAGDGYRVRYAIADVPAFVAAGGPIDAEARERGQTFYAPDRRIPLHPTVISEQAASLLPGQASSAFVWTFELDAAAAVTSFGLARATIRSRHQHSYREAQDAVGSEECLRLLSEVGPKRRVLERERGGASLDRPEEEVLFDGTHYELVRRSPLPIENWNAQLSLMTGMAAAQLMLGARIGILRTMPAPEQETLDRFRLQVEALGCPWPQHLDYGEYLRGLDRADPRGLAAIHAAASLFRGAGYTAFDGELPEGLVQAAVAAPYAHTTAPLRRLVDRFVLVACEAIATGSEVPGWVRSALPELPKIMARSDSLASRLNRSSVDAIEAALLKDSVGAEFEAVVIAERNGGGIVQLTEPVVTARVEGAVRAGQRIRAELVTADIPGGTILFRA